MLSADQRVPIPARGPPGSCPSCRVFAGAGCSTASRPPHKVWHFSADLRKKLVARLSWTRALCREGGDRIRQFMTDGDEIDGVRVKVAELTGDAGDIAVMLPWTLHNLSMNSAPAPRFMVTHTIFRLA